MHKKTWKVNTFYSYLKSIAKLLDTLEYAKPHIQDYLKNQRTLRVMQMQGKSS
jgi:hypothetical protein